MSPSGLLEVNMGPTAWKISDITWGSTESGVFEIERAEIQKFKFVILDTKVFEDLNSSTSNHTV